MLFADFPGRDSTKQRAPDNTCCSATWANTNIRSYNSAHFCLSAMFSIEKYVINTGNSSPLLCQTSSHLPDLFSRTTRQFHIANKRGDANGYVSTLLLRKKTTAMN